MNHKAKTQVKKLLRMLADTCTKPGNSDHDIDLYKQLQNVIIKNTCCEDPMGMATTLRELAKLVK